MNKKLAAICLTLAMTVLSPVQPSIQASEGFSDLAGHWAMNDIVKAVRDQYADGMPDGSFQPDRPVTRAEFLKLVIAALKYETKPQAAGQSWYSSYVDAAVSNGIHQAQEFDGADAMNGNITREEMARIAVRATGQANYDAKKWMYLATSKGIIRGMDDTGKLGEGETTTRAQAITVIERVKSVRAGEVLYADKHAVSRAEVLWHRTNIFTMLPRYFNPEIMDRKPIDLSKAQWDSSDGIYHEEVLEYVVVDMEDPNDPFRGEIEGLETRKNTYVTYSKVKQVITGQYPLNLHIGMGGGIKMSQLVPYGIYANKVTGTTWYSEYKEKENADTIYYSQIPSKKTSDWNLEQGLNPYWAKDFSASGGTYYYITAETHPKGDYYSIDRDRTYLTYTPNLSYMKTYGPDKTTALYSIATNYNLHN